MAVKTNEKVLVKHGKLSTEYFFSPKHRGNPTDEISVWLITHLEELEVFNTCFANSWIVHSNGWGVSKSLSLLGENLRNRRLILAKFVFDQNLWHGYPADLRYKPKDKPVPDILMLWYQAGLIDKPTLSRIKQGQI